MKPDNATTVVIAAPLETVWAELLLSLIHI